MDRVETISIALQTIASTIDRALLESAGERVGFVVLLNIDDVAQYISNVPRSVGIDMLKELLQRWQTDQPDTPAHLNPSVQKN